MMNVNNKYKKGLITIYNKDCLNFIKSMDDESVDLIVTSPPYHLGKEYDYSRDLTDFLDVHMKLLPEAVRILKKSGSICWQIGYYIGSKSIVPLDFLIYEISKNIKDIFLRNRIIWTFGHGLHSIKRFSGRHETILWFTKRPDNYFFNLNSVRVPQKYPGKKHYKGDKKGEYSGNPLGKNPSDVWDIPNVKSNHVEKTIHPCQFPVALAQQLIRALCPKNGVVFDPFLGSGTTAITSIIEKRHFVGCEINVKYFKLAMIRCEMARKNALSYRAIEKPIYIPNKNQKVAQKPTHFRY